MSTKNCADCRLLLTREQFYASPRYTDGLVPYCRKCFLRRDRESRESRRAQLIELLGGRCSRCGESDPRVLQFDHVAGDGAAHRREVGRSPHTMLRLIRESVERGEVRFQLLCANFNWKKRLEQNEGGDDAGRPPGLPQSDATRAKISIAIAKSWARDDVREARTQSIQETWASKSETEIVEHSAKISAGKAASPEGLTRSAKNLVPMTPEIRAFGIAASANARRGVALNDEHRTAISASLRAAYAEGRRKRGHSEETRRKISESKIGAGATRQEVWDRHGGKCSACGGADRPHKGGGLCTRCWQTNRNRKIKTGEVVGPARWSRESDACSSCSGNDSPHKSDGICSRCYQRLRKSAAARDRLAR